MVYDYENKHLYLKKVNGMVFDIALRGNKYIYVIRGDSATGKTYLYNSIKDMQELMQTFSAIEDTEDVSNILLVNMHTGTDAIFKAMHKLIIMDDADNILVPDGDLVTHINNDKENHYLIFIRKAVGLRTTPNYCGKLVSKDNLITVEWLADIGRWF